VLATACGGNSVDERVADALQEAGIEPDVESTTCAEIPAVFRCRLTLRAGGETTICAALVDGVLHTSANGVVPCKRAVGSPG
jgi:diacylglycerol kinase family enzyme